MEGPEIDLCLYDFLTLTKVPKHLNIFNIKAKTLKLLEEYIGEYMYNLEIGKDLEPLEITDN